MKIMNWRHWTLGLFAAFIGGGAAAVTATFTASLIAPEKFNLSSQIGNFFMLAGTTFAVNGFLNAMSYLKQSPIPKEEDVDTATISKPKPDGGFALRGLVMLIGFISLVAAVVYFACGCAIGTSLASRQTIMTNGVVLNDRAKSSFIAWGDSRQAIASQKISNTKSGNSIGQTGLDQETSASNAVQILKIVVEGGAKVAAP